VEPFLYTSTPARPPYQCFRKRQVKLPQVPSHMSGVSAAIQKKIRSKTGAVSHPSAASFHRAVPHHCVWIYRMICFFQWILGPTPFANSHGPVPLAVPRVPPEQPINFRPFTATFVYFSVKQRSPIGVNLVPPAPPAVVTTPQERPARPCPSRFKRVFCRKDFDVTDPSFPDVFWSPTPDTPPPPTISSASAAGVFFSAAPAPIHSFVEIRLISRLMPAKRLGANASMPRLVGPQGSRSHNRVQLKNPYNRLWRRRKPPQRQKPIIAP